jgi:anion-transporting  ArsA/GET3 family ATPase
MTQPSFDARLLPLLVVTGKGGVGKTTVAAALAGASAGLGHGTLLVEVDPRENAHQMLGIPPSGGEVAEAREHLWLQNLRPRDVLDRIVRDRVRLAVVSRRIIESPVYQQFAEGCPGLEELAILGHCSSCLKGEVLARHRIERVILDAPATGHGVSLLAAPELVADAITSGPIGRLAGELSELVRDPDRCGVVAVTKAEEMPMDETLELLEALRDRLHRRPEMVVANGLYPEVPPDFEPRDAVDRLWVDRRRVNERQLERLGGRWDGPRPELRQLPMERGPELVDRLAADLRAQLRGSGR